MVAAGVGRAGLRVGMSMFENTERVQLANDPDGRARESSPEVTLDAGEGDATFVLDAELVQLVADELRGLHLVEPRLGVVQYVPGDAD